MATTTRTRPVRDSLHAYAALVRLPNLFTTPPDVLAGAAVGAAALAAAGSGGGTGTAVRLLPVGVDPLALAGVVVASVLLYAGGTTLNDVADAAEDRRERPERPIPSGAVSRRAGLALALGCLLVGPLVALSAAGTAAGIVAGALALVVVAYDVALKGSLPGFLAMGAARGLNVALGVAAVDGALGAPSFPLPPAGVALLAAPLVALGYVAALTAMAEHETGAGGRRAIRITGLASLVAAVAAPLLVLALAGPGAALLAAVGSLAFLGWVGRPLRRAHADPAPSTVGPAVGACVLGLVLFDAALAAAAGPLLAAAVVAHLVPARLLASAFSVS